MRELLFGFLVLAAASSVNAQKPDPCASSGTTIEINECAQKVLRQKDGELNEAYQALLKSLSPSRSGDSTDYASVKKELAEAQRAWVKFRDSDCGAKYKFWEQGSIRGAMYLSCLTERTEQRTAELRKWAEI
jgi:uncharacterized protein YecT (DUF1311 family)